jgi:hypothetical protein
LKQLTRSIELAAAADLRLAVWGRHGVGKTGVVEQLDKATYYVKTIILSQSDPLVLGGFPGREQIGVTVDGVQEFITTFAKPQWIIDIEVAAENGLQPVVFLDEFNRADVYAHNAAMRLVNEKEICGHKLPASTCFIAAMNPETDGDGAVQPLTDPMVDRWCHIAVHSDPEFWLDWAKSEKDNKPNVNSVITGFISSNHSRLNAFSMDELFGQQVASRIKPTERSNHAVSRLLDVVAAENNVDPSALEAKVIQSDTAIYNMIAGLCGKEYAIELLTYLADNYCHPFTVEEMLSGDEKVLERAQDLKNKSQTQVLITSLETAFTEVANLFDNDKDKALKGKKLHGFFDFLTVCPVDSQQAFWEANNMSDKPNETVFWKSILLNPKTPKKVRDSLRA